MAREQTLLNRIASGSDRGRSRHEATATENLDALIESVQTHLVRLLNSRQGMAEAQPDYGLPSLVDITVGSGNYVQLVQDTIRQTIEKFEPRLRRVRVSQRLDEEATADKEKLIFRIDAILVGRSGEHRVWYETAFRGTNFEVAG